MQAYRGLASHRLTLLLGTVWLSSTVVLADASTGELFGFQIGSRYQPTSGVETCSWRPGGLKADNPQKPEDIQEVCLRVTSITNTITNITGFAWTTSVIEAIDLANEYKPILRAMYRDWPIIVDSYIGSTTDDSAETLFVVNLDDRYELLVSARMDGSGSFFRIELTSVGDKELNELRRRELDELILQDENKTRGL